jgi:hypothetical protein
MHILTLRAFKQHMVSEGTQLALGGTAAPVASDAALLLMMGRSAAGGELAA